MSQIKRAKKHVNKFSDYQEAFGTEPGKRVLHDMIKTHYVMGSTFDINPSEMCLREGERNVVLRILHNLGVDVETLLKHIADAQLEGEYDV